MKDLKYISLAHKLNTEHHELMLQNKLHFRGNVKSLSLISLAKETPEIGESNLRTEKGALQKLEAIIKGVKVLSKNRSTREKELQAWLILKALATNKQLFFDTQLQFITSELALYDNESRIVNDILAIDNQDNLVVIELKSKRDKKRIEVQVENFIKIIENNKLFFTELVALHTNRTWNGKIKGIVVWPNSTKNEKVIRNEYREFCYSEKTIDGNKVIDYINDEIQFIELT